LEAKVPAERWREVKATALAACHASSPKMAEIAPEEFRKTWATSYRAPRSALRMISQLALRACGCRWRTVKPRVPLIFLSDCFSKNGDAPEPFRMPLVNVPVLKLMYAAIRHCQVN